MPRFLLVSLALALVAAQHLALALPVEAPEMVAPAPGPAAGEHETPPAGDTDENLPSESESAEASLPPKPAKIMEDLDTNHDGKITHDELAARLKWVHEKENADRPEGSVEAEIAQMLKDEDHKSWFNGLDKDKDGSLSLQEKLADLAGDVGETEEDKKNMAAMTEHETKDFEWCDKDGDGKLSFEEMVRGQAQPKPDNHEDHHEEYMAEVDADKDNHVTLNEHLKNMNPDLTEEEKKSMSAEEMTVHKESIADAMEDEKTRFTKADKNQDGKLTSEEYATIFEDGAEGEAPSHGDTAKDLLEGHDKNHDGVLSVDEIGTLGGADGEEGAESLGWETHPPHVLHPEL